YTPSLPDALPISQQRSAPRSIEVVQAIKEGAIGQPYLGRVWYANTRATIGRGKTVPVPANLDYELWRGPAPHTPYRDNIIHYNWHWFRRLGTGEISNNGTHEIDVARWALGVSYPTRVTSVGGRYHFADDWEFPDTQEACFEFAGGKTIIWQGQSCNGLTTFGRERGTAILGTTGSVVMDRDGYVVSDLHNKVVKQSLASQHADGLNISADDDMTALHIANFVEAIRSGAARELYDETRTLPIVSPHGHVDPASLARNERFAEPAALIVQPDHYILRLLYARGVPLEALGVPRRDRRGGGDGGGGGAPVETDACKVWKLFADHYYLFRGTPTGAWLDYELHEVFGVRDRLSGETAARVYDEVAEKLASPEFLPRALFERFNIEVLATTVSASDSLDHHLTIRGSGWKGRVIPCFRPDAVFRMATPEWAAQLEALGREHGAPLVDYAEFVRALEDRR